MRFYTGGNDILFGSVVSGRPADLPGVETMIGLFINTLPVRVSIAPEESLLAYLVRLHTEQVEMRQYEYTPLVDIHRWSDMPQNRALFECLYVFESYPKGVLGSNGSSPNGSNSSGLRAKGANLNSEEGYKSALTIRSYQVLEQSNFPLVFATGPDTELTLAILYDRGRFDDAVIGRMWGYLQDLLEAIAHQPEKPIHSLLLFPGQIASNAAQSGAHHEQLRALAARSNLTMNQMLVWLGQTMQPESPHYNDASFAFSIAAKVDRVHFQNAIQTLINSCDALRIVIEEIDGVPQQRVLDTFTYEVETLDFSQSEEPYASFQTWARQRSQVPFDFTKPLFAFALVKISERHYVWYMLLHQIISDDNALWLLFEHLSDF